jgi:hypothetical protein
MCPERLRGRTRWPSGKHSTQATSSRRRRTPIRLGWPVTHHWHADEDVLTNASVRSWSGNQRSACCDRGVVEKVEIGGVLVTPLEVDAAIAKLEAVGGTAIAQPLRAIGSPLAACKYHEVAKATRTAFPTLVKDAGTKQKHTPHEKVAFVFALKVHAGYPYDLPGGPAEGDLAGSGPGHDLIAGRRTAKKNYGEYQAAEWAGKTFRTAMLIEKVADQVPKLGYDVRVILADGAQVHIEAKASAGDGSLVALEEGERAHIQDSDCEHEHVLFVLSAVQAAEIDGEWKCSGGHAIAIRDWTIASADLELQPSWLYRVPAAAQGSRQV